MLTPDEVRDRYVHLESEDGKWCFYVARQKEESEQFIPVGTYECEAQRAVETIHTIIADASAEQGRRIKYLEEVLADSRDCTRVALDRIGAKDRQVAELELELRQTRHLLGKYRDRDDRYAKLFQPRTDLEQCHESP